jgi:hypothetical protein
MRGAIMTGLAIEAIGAIEAVHEENTVAVNTEVADTTTDTVGIMAAITVVGMAVITIIAS